MGAKDIVLAAQGAAVQPPDPYFENVTLLLHGDGTNGGQNNTFIDSSANNLSITRNGTTTQGSFSPYGNLWSNYFSASYLTINSNLVISAGQDFTVEAWINWSSFTSSDQGRCLFSIGSETTNRVQFTIDNGSPRLEVFANALNLVASDKPVSLNTWTHVAWVRQSGVIKIYVNGVASTNTATSSAVLGNSSVSYVGYRDGTTSSASGALGYISNIRFVRGSAVYTTNFTPSTIPLTAISNTTLLTCQSNRFIDNSANNFTLVRNGDVSVQRFSPFQPVSAYSTSAIGGSSYHPGASGNYLLTNSSNLAFGTGDFTVEAWVYMTNNTDYRGVFQISTSTNGVLDSTANSSAVTFYPNGTGISFYGNNADNVYARTIYINTWYHIALVRNSGTTSLYLNGALVGSVTDNVNYTGGYLAIGGIYYTNQFGMIGYISGFRVVKGTAVYTSAFTPPTAPPTPITNTQFLCNMTNGAIFDNAMMNDLETVGNAQIDTTVKKYGTGSLYFDGDVDYLDTPNNLNFRFLTAPFTIEMWVYITEYFVPPGAVTQQFLFSGSDNGNDNAVNLAITSTGKLLMLNWSTAIAQSSASIPLNAWTHVAGTFDGTTYRTFINGNLDGSGSGTIYNFNSSVSYRIGTSRSYPTYGGYFKGNIDDLRITKGIARYTSNFTPPTAAFPNT